MKINEENFVKQIKKRDERALSYVIDQYGGILKSIIGKHLFAFPNLQEECLNDVLLGIWNNIVYFDSGKNSFKNWAAGIARFKSVDYLRKYIRDLQNDNWEDTVVSGEDPGMTRLIEEEISEETEAMLNCLSPDDRELFMNLYVRELSIEEVSEKTGMKKAVIYNHLSRGKKRIREIYPNEKGVKSYES